MGDAMFKSLSLVDASGYFIIATIVVLLLLGIVCTLLLRRRYRRMEQELHTHPGLEVSFDSPVLNHIVRAAMEAQARTAGEINTQAIIDQHFQSELRRLLLGERFVKSVTGLLIILGLVGTFYGLTLSIGQLVTLLAGDAVANTDLAESLSQGLTQALSGMSVAFSTSLFGIAAAIVMTLIGVFFNVGDHRTAVMIQIENYIDNVLLAGAALAQQGVAGSRFAGARAGAVPDERFERAINGFGQSVSRLEGVVGEFHQALQSFSTSTREFGELNLHLKDNIQRMSLSFADLSDTLRKEVGSLKDRERGSVRIHEE